jgi:imidazolonepropionase-like amidohydrolase
MAVVIENVTLIDGTGAAARPGSTVVVEGDRISAVQPAGGSSELPAGAERIDGRGKWLLPGLIDMHVHVALVGEEALPLWLGTGVTTVRDVGGDISVLLPLRDAVNRGERLGPRVLSYGPMLDGDPSIFAGVAGSGPPQRNQLSDITWINRTIAEGEASIDRLLEAGVDGIKLYAGLRPDLLTAMIKRVNGRVPVTGHLSRTWASEAIDAGINCLEHVHATVYQDVARPADRHERERGNGFIPNYWTWLTQGWANVDLEAPYVHRLVEQLVANGVCLSPTTVLATGGMATTEALQDPTLPVYTTPSQRRRREDQAQRMAALRAEAQRQGRTPPGLQQVDPEAGARALQNELGFLLMVHRAGGTVTPSTDVGAAPNQVPGFSLHQELELFVRAGFTPLEAIHAATAQAARVTRHPEIGTVEPGKAADLLLLDADPLAAIANTRRVQTVIRAGRAHDAAALLAGFRESAAQAD